MKVEIFDTHAHLDGSDFADDRHQVIQRAREAGVSTIVTVGTDLESSRQAIEIAESYPNLYAAVGWHPNDAKNAPKDVGAVLRDLARHPKVVALGEMGLDYYRLPKLTPSNAAELAHIKQNQSRVFAQQLDLAVELGLNCIVHQRGDCFEDTLAIMRPYAGKLRAVFHCFSEGPDRLRQLLDLNFMVSFTGIITFRSAQLMRESLAAVPMDRFMLETDCPYLAPEPHRGQRCEPAHVMETARWAVEVKQCTLEDLSLATCANAKRFFGRI